MDDLQITIYLAGNIQKGHEKESEIFWTLNDQKILAEGLAPSRITFLNPAVRADDLSDQKSVFGRDMTQVYFADVIFVDARERRGLGVGAEMMWAKMNRIPVVTLAPSNSHYQRKEANLLGIKVENWIHPFVESLSDEIISNLAEGIGWLKEFILGRVQVKGPEYISEAMSHYQSCQLSQDVPMKKIIESNLKLQTRIKNFRTASLTSNSVLRKK